MKQRRLRDSGADSGGDAGAEAPLSAQRGDALLIVGVQNDFMPGGSRAVSRGYEVVPVLNFYIERFRARGLPVFAARNWYPADHRLFREQGGPWPAHCVAGTAGAHFAPGLDLPHNTEIVSKTGHSSFAGTDLDVRLRALAVRRLFVGGLVTEHAVYDSVKDALRLGYEAVLLEDATRAMNVRREDGLRARRELERLGAKLYHDPVAAPSRFAGHGALHA
ncbi:MAG: isochorismatase family protein [Nevskia sp.]|nr:isochorismatase family protein [Nevskia sp.]